MSVVAATDRQGSGRSAFWVHVKPRSRQDAIVGRSPDGSWEIRVQAPPVKGAANEACRRLLARALGVAPSRVEVERGEGARRKKVSVSGLEPDEVCLRLMKAVGGTREEKR